MSEPVEPILPLDALRREHPWSGIRVVVAGFDESGAAVADNLLFLGAQVTALDETPGRGGRGERADLLSDLGAAILLEEGATAVLPDACDLLVLSAGWSATHPLVAQALARDVTVWSDVELAWRLRQPGAAGREAPWLVIAGAHGRDQTAVMTAAILLAAGLTPALAGGQGRPVIEVVMDPAPYDVVVLDVNAEQLHFTSSMAAESAVVLNVGELEGSDADPSATQVADLGQAFHGVAHACIYNAAEPLTRDLVAEADVVEGARGIGITLGMPSVGMLGVVEDIVVDRAFIAERSTSAAELCTVADLGEITPARVTNALAAAALARAHGVSQEAVRDGLRHAG